MDELLTPSQMGNADRLAIEAGTAGIKLMENAGIAIADLLEKEFPNARSVLVVCGDITRISGDAELALARLDPPMLLDQTGFQGYDVIVDALLGAGLDRDVGGEFAAAISKINASETPVLSVDLPSGVDGRTGKIMGEAIRAKVTCTFFRLKPGHLLMPGRLCCGRRSLHQIGIGESVIAQTGCEGFRNNPQLWLDHFPIPSHQGHKFDRGSTVILSGPAHATGAARLMADAALRIGSGLVTVASPADALDVNASHLTSVMLVEAGTPKAVAELMDDKRITCAGLGPGLPPGRKTQKMVLKVLAKCKVTVLDAGALTSFENAPGILFDAIRACRAPVFLTPHDGEFSRLFPEESALACKIDRAKIAAVMSNATVILKGPDTVVATPQGQVSISDNAPPWLATAGSGDVLAGTVAGPGSPGHASF